MSHPFENKNKSRAELENIKNNQFSQKGLFVNDDDQDWGSAGMNDIQNETDISQNGFLSFSICYLIGF